MGGSFRALSRIAVIGEAVAAICRMNIQNLNEPSMTTKLVIIRRLVKKPDEFDGIHRA